MARSRLELIRALARPRRLAALAGRRGGVGAAALATPLLALDPNSGLATASPRPDGEPRHLDTLATWSAGGRTLTVDASQSAGDRPTYDDLYRSVTLKAATRGAAFGGGAVLSGRPAWTLDAQIRGRIGHLGADAVLWQESDDGGAGLRVGYRAAGQVFVEVLGTGGSVLDSAESTETFWHWSLVASATATAVDSGTRTRLVFTLDDPASHRFCEMDTVTVTGAASLSGLFAAVAKVDSATNTIAVVFDGTRTAPTAGELAAGVRIVHQGQVEYHRTGPEYPYASTERLPIRLSVRRDGDDFRFTFRDHAEEATVAGMPLGPSGGVTACLGAAPGSSLDSAPVKVHGLRAYGEAIDAATDADLMARHGFVFSRTRHVGPGQVFFAGWEYPGIPRLEASFCRYFARLRAPDGSARPEHAYPDGASPTANLAGHQRTGHNPTANPTTPHWQRIFGDVDATGPESTSVEVTVFGPEQTLAGLVNYPLPDLIYHGTPATVTIEPIPGTWTRASFSAASPFSAANLAAVAPCTVWTLAEGDSFGNIYGAGYASAVIAAEGPFVLRGAGDAGASFTSKVEVEGASQVLLWNLHVKSAPAGSGTPPYFAVDGTDGLACYNLRVGDPAARTGNYGVSVGLTDPNRFIAFQRGAVQVGDGYGVYWLGNIQFASTVGMHVEPALPNGSGHHSIRSDWTYFVEHVGRRRAEPSLEAYSGPTFRGSSWPVAMTDDDFGSGEENTSHDAFCDRPLFFERIRNKMIRLDRSSRSMVRQSLSVGLKFEIPNSSDGRALFADPRAHGNRSKEESGEYLNFRSAPTSGVLANHRNASYSYGTLAAPELLRAERRGAAAVLELAGYPRGGSYWPTVRWEVRPAATGVVAEAEGVGSCAAVLPYDGPADYRAVAVERDADGVATGNEAASAWVRVGAVASTADLSPCVLRLDGPGALAVVEGYDYNGTDEYHAGPALALGTSFAVSLWIRPGSSRLNKYIFTVQDNGSGTNRAVTIDTDGSSQLRAAVAGASGSASVTRTGALVADRLYHVLVERSGTTLSMTVDGGTPLTATDPAMSGSPSPTATTIGAYLSPSAARQFDGIIGVPIAWDRALTTAEKAEAYNGGAPIRAAHLAASTRSGVVFAPAAIGGDWVDADNAVALADVGAPPAADLATTSAKSDGDPVSTWTDAVRLLAPTQATAASRPSWDEAAGMLDFDGAGDSLSVAGNPAYAVDALTVLARVNLDAYGASGSTICKAVGAGGSWSLGLTAAGLVAATYDPDDGASATATGAGAVPLSADAWVGFRLNADGTLAAFAVSGGAVAHGEAATPGAGRAVASATFTVGDGTLDGRLGPLLVVGRAADDADILAAIAGEG